MISDCAPQRGRNPGGDEQLEYIDRKERVEAGAQRGVQSDRALRKKREPQHATKKDQREVLAQLFEIEKRKGVRSLTLVDRTRLTRAIAYQGIQEISVSVP